MANVIETSTKLEMSSPNLAVEYPYQFNPHQLVYLCHLLDEAQNVDGHVAEVGCAYGHTTVFLNRYLDSMRYMPKRYIAVDTFSGFVPTDVAYEVTNRYKAYEMYDAFRDNSRELFEASMARHRISRVDIIETDVNEFDMASVGPLAMALVDLDLYRPIKKILPELYSVLSPGGIIVVDDCNPMNFYWDGAYQAYAEFVRSQNALPRVVLGKLGLITKPSANS